MFRFDNNSCNVFHIENSMNWILSEQKCLKKIY